MSVKLTANRIRLAIALGLLTGTASLAASPAAAGECPADQIMQGALTSGETMPKDVTDDVLEAAARMLAERLNTALRLTDRPEAVHLAAGPACRWCGLAPTCPEKQRWDDERADTAADVLPF